ncbi:MerR family transcriptional regulator [Lysinibacillus capsici]|uniref:MerR family transcriptional regulator n=1 Tax=Lysinibacillus capsici TaxID=2115968 RepID=UPI002731D95E|nr:MerR family transcriptional regulator [Lysinibacillus capsici]MDP1392407.1 MerR family transcriptional regulator [Lysinibacillus capsici]MDP1412881.1 MerR family transcriptional regulator [Lysinibacillus capsici]MDP1428486.1 MerR family transcriptional regulator [Lysinibacillus capsici]
MKEHYYTIGEVAKLSNLSVQTLRYYDQIDLFKPAYIDTFTNYRYYKGNQLFYLDIIKSLKYIGVTLDDIKKALRLTSEELLDFLAQQELRINEKISRLNEAKNTLLKTKKQLQEQIDIPVFGEIYVQIEEAMPVLQVTTTQLTPTSSTSTYYATLIKIIEKEGSVLNSRYGCIYPLEPYKDVNDIIYDAIFTPLLTERTFSQLSPNIQQTIIPGGKYVCIAFIYDPDTYFSFYEKLRNHVLAQQELFESQVYELYMPATLTMEQEKKFIVELKIRQKQETQNSSEKVVAHSYNSQPELPN